MSPGSKLLVYGMESNTVESRNRYIRIGSCPDIFCTYPYVSSIRQWKYFSDIYRGDMSGPFPFAIPAICLDPFVIIIDMDAFPVHTRISGRLIFFRTFSFTPYHSDKFSFGIEQEYLPVVVDNQFILKVNDLGNKAGQ